MNMKNVKLAFS